MFKYILVGEASVGKSTILNRFIHGGFNSDVNPTMGVEFGTKLTNVKGRKIKVQVWDTVLAIISRQARSPFAPSLVPITATPSESSSSTTLPPQPP